METLTAILIVLQILVSILLTFIILVQPSKSGGGLGGALGGGGMSEQLFGARTGNVLTKATVIFASLFLINTVALAVIYSRANDDEYALPSAEPPPGIMAMEESEAGVETETHVENPEQE